MEESITSLDVAEVQEGTGETMLSQNVDKAGMGSTPGTKRKIKIEKGWG